MSDTVRLKFTVTISGEYDADPSDYDTADPAEMIAIDQSQLAIDDLVGLCETGGYKLDEAIVITAST